MRCHSCPKRTAVRVLFVSLLLNGCATQTVPIPISNADLGLLEKQNSVSTAYYSSDLHIAMPFEGGLLGEALSNETVQKEVRPKVKIDPAKVVMNRFLNDLASSRHLASPTFNEIPNLKEADERTLASEAKDGMIWEFRTQRWSLVYKVLSPRTYYIKRFWIRARLVSKAGERVMWQGVCKYPGDNSSPLERDFDLLFKGNGINEMMDPAYKDCANELVSQFKQRSS